MCRAERAGSQDAKLDVLDARGDRVDHLLLRLRVGLGRHGASVIATGGACGGWGVAD
jgi:hypothetical protein